MPDPGVEIAAEVIARNVKLEATFTAGRMTAVVGPNGAGKSTLLQLIAGQIRPSSGSVHLAGKRVSSPDGHVPTHRRNVAMLAQRAALFPHLSVLDNVAFGPRARGASKGEALRRANAELEAVGCAPLASRMPRELSGGQAQRVAIARALVVEPDVILLDEPLASLDVSVASSLRTLLAERLRGRTALMVTHDVIDLWTLADEMALIESGRIVAAGAVEELMGRPATGFLAGLGGLNRLTGTAVAPDELALTDSALVVTGSAQPESPADPGAPAMALFEPAAVALYRAAPVGSPRNVWPVFVEGIEPRGSLVRVRLRQDGGQRLSSDITPRSVADLGLEPGERRWASVKAAQVRIERRAHRDHNTEDPSRAASTGEAGRPNRPG